jgi:RHS repeat-associated protein
VYFDELKISHVKSRVVQQADYYPFGLAMSTSWTRETAVSNNYLYNAGSELNDNTQWYEMFFRGYDPALGRMLQIDPVASKYASVSPYNYSFNDPVALNDPSGADPYDPNHYYHRGGPYNSNAYFYTDMVYADGGFPHRDRGDPIYGNERLNETVLGRSIYNWQDVYAKGMAMVEQLRSSQQAQRIVNGIAYTLASDNGGYVDAGRGKVGLFDEAESILAGSMYKATHGTLTALNALSVQLYFETPTTACNNCDEINVFGTRNVQDHRYYPLSLSNSTLNQIMWAFRDAYEMRLTGYHNISQIFDATGIPIQQTTRGKIHYRTFNNGIAFQFVVHPPVPNAALGYDPRILDTVTPFYPGNGSRGWNIDPATVPTNTQYPYAMYIGGRHTAQEQISTLFFSDYYAFLSFMSFVKGN